MKNAEARIRTEIQQHAAQVWQSLAAQAQQDQAAQAQVPGAAFMSPMGFFGGAQPQAAPHSTGGLLPGGTQHVWGSVSRLPIAAVCPMVLCRQWPNGHGLLRVLQRD